MQSTLIDVGFVVWQKMSGFEKQDSYEIFNVSQQMPCLR